MIQDAWLEAHSYLRPLAGLTAQVDRAAAGIEISEARIPDWEAYRQDFLAGVPLLTSTAVGVDLEPGERMATALLEQLGDAISAEALSGMLRFVSWTAMALYLRPIVTAFDAWRDDDKWMRRLCPTCGSLPAMAQLVGADPGRKRLLSCGCCCTRWQFKRTGCPFCEADSQRLASIAIDGDPRLRIDHCESCRGYLKTYNGEGEEALLLADWTSLHLDLIAHDRGLKRRAASLYEFEPAGSSSTTTSN
jgi:FdhE protein